MTFKTTALTAELRALAGVDGKIIPKEVVEWAKRHRRSALYGELNWDDESAAEAHRIWQVRQLIAVHVVDDAGFRSHVSLSIDRTAGGGYRPLSNVLSRVDLRAVMLNDALEDLKRLQSKYDRLTELSRVWAERDAVETRAKRKSAAPKRKASETRKRPRRGPSMPARRDPGEARV